MSFAAHEAITLMILMKTLLVSSGERGFLQRLATTFLRVCGAHDREAAPSLYAWALAVRMSGPGLPPATAFDHSLHNTPQAYLPVHNGPA